MKEMRLLWFELNTPVHHSPGLWRHPRNHSHDYLRLSYWVDMAKTLERGKFDGLFLADIAGIYDVYGGGADAALSHAVQVPANDPLLLIPAMAHATEHLGFAVTVNISNELPHPFARRMSTLDHLTNGRICWNIVTGYLNSGAKAIGRSEQVSHDARYDIADEFMNAVYKLWEGGWEDGAVVRDQERGVYTDPSKVHYVNHYGENFRIDAMHLCEPSPQRTPFLFQAGSSPRGVAFAARHAECVFVGGPSAVVVGELVSRLRDAVKRHGRDPSRLQIFMGVTVIAGRTDEEAQAKYDEYRNYADPAGVLIFLSGASGIDFSTFDLDEPITEIRSKPGAQAMETATRILTADPNKSWTLRELGEFGSIGGPTPKIVGSPQRVADELQRWMATTGVDGFNLIRTVTPECLVDFVDLVVPELQARGIYKADYAKGVFRHKMLGSGPRLDRSHYGAQFAF